MKALFLVLVLLSMGYFSNARAEKRVLMFVSTGFYAPEYYTPRKILSEAGFKITVAAKYEGLTYPDRRNTEFQPVKADITFKDVKIEDYDAFVFAGGNGAWEDFFPNEDVHKIVAGAVRENKVLALLCTATGLLAIANNFDGTSKPVAEGRDVTGYKRVEGMLKLMGKVNYLPGVKGEPQVVVDGNLITGRDPISSEKFGKTIVKILE